MAEFKDITKDNFDTDVLASKGLTLIYFYTAWSKQCQEADEILQTAATEVDGQMEIVRVNTDLQQEIVAQQKVRTIPLFQVLKAGKVIEVLRGVPSKLELIGMLSNVISEHGTEESSGEELA
ncbi:MAG: thioredoxin 1 [Candidatus Latescibacterota bacterium]|jgi:thioredoxin 1